MGSDMHFTNSPWTRDRSRTRHGRLATSVSLLVALAMAVTACSQRRDPSTAEEAAKRGDELLRKMSDTLKSAPSLSFSVSESHERMKRNGQKEPYTLTREVMARRPDRLWVHTTGSDRRDVKVTYNGKTVTIVSDDHKIYATINAPATLDETLDLISHRYDLRVAVGDFLYSSPYDSFAGSDAKGGWTKRTTVDGKQCEEVAYSFKEVDVALSVTSAEPSLPCETQITFKEEPGQPVTRLVFSNWNLKPELGETQFAAHVPQGYELVPVVERIPKSEIKADAAKAMGVQPKP